MEHKSDSKVKHDWQGSDNFCAIHECTSKMPISAGESKDCLYFFQEVLKVEACEVSLIVNGVDLMSYKVKFAIHEKDLRKVEKHFH